MPVKIYFSFSTLAGVSLQLTIVLLLRAMALMIGSILFMGNYFYPRHFNKAALYKFRLKNI